MKKTIARTITFVLIIVIFSSFVLTANAADVGIQASLYINSIDCSITPYSGGRISITASVTGTGVMDKIGVSKLTIQKYQAGSWVDEASWTDLYDYNTIISAIEGSYYGIAGNKYRAVITFYAGRDGGYDTRIVTTSAVTAIS